MEKIIKFNPVKSSQITGEFYDKKKQTLFLRFRNKSIYFYLDVTSEEYDAFKAADSQGSYFYKNIKQSKSFKKL